MSTVQPSQPPASRRGKRAAIIGVLGVILAVLFGAFLVWFVFFSSTAPAAPTIEGAAAVIEGSPGAEPTPAVMVTPDPAPASGTDGRWVVDTSIGSGDGATNSFVGFRVAEVLQRIGEAEAIGRTPGVEGELALNGAVLESVSIQADLTQIRSDQSRRDPAIQRALQTSEFPAATFVSSGSVDLAAIPADGETIEVSVPGTLTVHGISTEVEVSMSARLVGDVVVVVGTLPVDFTDFGITMPTAPIVVSVEDAGDLEWQLFFRREG